MSVLSTALMDRLLEFQTANPAFAGESFSDRDQYGCRNACSGSCEGDCVGSCGSTCHGGCEGSFGYE